MKYEYHPAANIFPIMTESEIDELSDDILQNGLLDPIELLDGKILDGRNRLRACEVAGIEPKFTDLELNGTSPSDHVWSRNYHRRQLTFPQKALVAAGLKKFKAVEAKEREREAGKRHGRGQKGM